MTRKDAVNNALKEIESLLNRKLSEIERDIFCLGFTNGSIYQTEKFWSNLI